MARRYLALEGRRVLAELAATDSAGGRAPPRRASRPPRPPTSRSRWPGAGARSPTRRSGSASSDPPGCWAHRRRAGRTGQRQRSPPGVRADRRARGATTTGTGSRPRKARSSSCSRTRSSTRTPSSDFLRKLFGASRSPGDGAAGGEMPVRSIRRVERRRAERPASPHPGSASPMTASPALPLAWAAPSTRSGTYTTTGTGRSGAGSSTFH